MKSSISSMCGEFRNEIKLISMRVKRLMGEEGHENDSKANIMLAYRHLEDARMRLGKVQFND